MKYSVIIPAYNEEKIIEDTIDKIYVFLKKQGKDFELIIANDGSVDNTLILAEKKSKRYNELRIISQTPNQGRGAVLTKAFKSIRGEIGVYIDADLAIDLELFPGLMRAIENGADAAVGSKHMDASEVDYPFLRRVASKGYSFLTRLFLGSKIKDYQCGFKAFRKDVLKKVLPYIHEKGWSWDTEIVVKSEWAGYKVKELPAKVVNIYERESKVYLFRDIKRMGGNLLRLWLEKKKYKRLLKSV
ncbi:MAG TPA: glycosyltransferase [Candidatus Nanoarchaeia archaeon]|nr:glycosyltransferase [Candidatus Nanoarchaeia archaeon]